MFGSNMFGQILKKDVTNRLNIALSNSIKGLVAYPFVLPMFDCSNVNSRGHGAKKF
jgi:hypothetical protein